MMNIDANTSSDETSRAGSGASFFNDPFFGALLAIVFVSCIVSYLNVVPERFIWLMHFCHTVLTAMRNMWFGLLVAIVAAHLLGRMPHSVLDLIVGRHTGFKGILRATLAGLVFDVCSHGILLIGIKLYQKGATLGQTMAFLIASPWNSISLVAIMFSLIGFTWTFTFVALSTLVAIVSGIIFERLVAKEVLPENINRYDIEAYRDNNPSITWLGAFKEVWQVLSVELSGPRHIKHYLRMFFDAVIEARSILRWILLGVVISGILNASLTAEGFEHLFGAHVSGLSLTLLAATLIEVCSEGATPIAADIVSMAGAPGNAFVFLMAGVATDYTEIITIGQATRSWKTAFFLPLVTLPQIVFLGWILNNI
jgi:hypothetical protein